MSFLSGIKEGAKFLLEHIWVGLKSVFGSKAAKDISLAALRSAKELLATEFGQFVQKVVTELEASALGGSERLAKATDNVHDYLEARGQQMSTVWVQWSIQTVLMFIRGLAAKGAPEPIA